MHQLDHPRAMDQRSQAMSVAGRAALLERIVAILARQHRERVSGDTQRLNEQQTIIDILRMLDYEEPAEGDHSQSRCGGQDKSDHSQSASSRPRYLVPPAEWRKLPDAARELIVREGRRKRQKRRRKSAAFRRATTRTCSASSRSSSRSSSSSTPAGDPAAAVAK